MALLSSKKFYRIEKKSNFIHGLTSAAYSSFLIDGKKYFQIDTYGSQNRLRPDKVSQTIQIDLEMAKIIIQELQKEFALIQD